MNKSSRCCLGGQSSGSQLANAHHQVFGVCATCNQTVTFTIPETRVSQTLKLARPEREEPWATATLEGCRNIEALEPVEPGMSCTSTKVRGKPASETPRARTLDMKLEVVVIPVANVDRAKRYADYTIRAQSGQQLPS
jgi:hypothetical protein